MQAMLKGITAAKKSFSVESEEVLPDLRYRHKEVAANEKSIMQTAANTTYPMTVFTKSLTVSDESSFSTTSSAGDDEPLVMVTE